MNLIETFRSELFKIFDKDPNTIYLGEDVRNAHRGIAIGLHERYGDERVLDMPISESAFTGFALGAAIAGKTIYVEYNFAGLVYLGLDQIFNQAHKYNEMMNANLPLKIVYILPTGTRGGLAGHHSDNPYSLLSHLGISSYLLATPFDCKEVFNHIEKEAIPTAIFLPVQSFTTESKTPSLTNRHWFGFYQIFLGKKCNIICTGTTYEIIKEAIKEINLDNPNIYILTDLLFSDQTKSAMNSIPKLPTIFMDDSFSRCGLCSEVQNIVPSSLWLEPISRIPSNIPFSKSMEDNIVASQKRIKPRLEELLK